jgi:ABC-type glutathione transport system ATPase component
VIAPKPAEEARPVLELNDVTVRIATGSMLDRSVVTAVNRVSVRIDAGRTLGLVGESGSGKTTSGMVALGLRRPTSGSVRFEGRPIPRRRRSLTGRMQAVLQHPQWSLNPRLHVGRSIAEPAVVAGGLSRADIAARCTQLLDHVGLSAAVAQRYPHELSGGQRQRVAIARALITRPSLIVFDEAVSALDVSVQAQILNLILDLQGEHGFAALFISHDLGATRYVAHQIAVMRHGEIVELADSDVFYDQPAHEYSRQLLEAL